jgi:hypothetical protein
MAEPLHRPASKQVDSSCALQFPCARSRKHESNILALINQLVNHVKNGRSALNLVNHEVGDPWVRVDNLKQTLRTSGQGATFIGAKQIYAVRIWETLGYPCGLSRTSWSEEKEAAS